MTRKARYGALGVSRQTWRLKHTRLKWNIRDGLDDAKNLNLCTIAQEPMPFF